jgi:2,3-bisphosphoglycerate-independent phosphoglycerate mutase
MAQGAVSLEASLVHTGQYRRSRGGKMDLKIAQQMTITELVLENQKLKLDAQREAEHHDRMVGELEKVYAERDEAREKAERYRLEANAIMMQRDEVQKKLEYYKERYEQLKEIPKWYNGREIPAEIKEETK